MRNKLSLHQRTGIAVLACLAAAAAPRATVTAQDRAANGGAVAAARASGGQSASRGNLPRITGYVSPGEHVIFDKYMEFPNSEKTLAVTYNGEPFDVADHPFFKVRPNGRACVTCHQPQDAMGISTKTI